MSRRWGDVPQLRNYRGFEAMTTNAMWQALTTFMEEHWNLSLSLSPYASALWRLGILSEKQLPFKDVPRTEADYYA